MAAFYLDVEPVEKANECWDKVKQIEKSHSTGDNPRDFEYRFLLSPQKQYRAAELASQGENVFVFQHVMAMLGKADAAQNEYLNERMSRLPQALQTRLMLVAARHLCGDTQVAKLLASRFIQQRNEGTSHAESQESLVRVMKYFAGDESPPEEFVILSESSSESELSVGVYVALHLIGEVETGIRAQAKLLAQYACDYSGIYSTCTCSRNLLKLLEDENWPRADWILTKRNSYFEINPQPN